jgi:hypothetical protein
MTAPPASKTRVFIAHTSQDAEWARQLRERLRAAGIDAWLDETDLAAGTDWAEAVRDAMAESSHVVFLVGRGAAGSNWLAFELGMALAAKKPIIPVLAPDVAPDEVPGPLRLRKAVRQHDLAEVVRRVSAAVAG